MFSQFFVDPLLLPDAVEREMNAIESEFQLNVNSDGCRWQELLCFSSKVCKGERQHPFGKFSWGNLQSLRDTPSQQEVNVMDELRRFYEQVSDVDSFIAQNFYTLPHFYLSVLLCCKSKTSSYWCIFSR